MSRILITGASRGLGRALAVELTRRGHTVVASARKIADLSGLEVAEKIALDVTVSSAKCSPGPVRRAGRGGRT